jgi:hypothetical protein
MLSDNLKRYQDLQSELTSLFVEFHNRNKDFIRAASKNSAWDTRRMLREIYKVAAEMKKLNLIIYEESVEAKREVWAKDKELLAQGIKKKYRYPKPKLAKGEKDER